MKVPMAHRVKCTGAGWVEVGLSRKEPTIKIRIGTGANSWFSAVLSSSKQVVFRRYLSKVIRDAAKEVRAP